MSNFSMSEQCLSPKRKKIYIDAESLNNSSSELEVSLTKDEMIQTDIIEEETQKSNKEDEECDLSKEIVLRKPRKGLSSLQNSKYGKKQSNSSRSSILKQNMSNKSHESSQQTNISNSQKSQTTNDRTSLYERSVNTAKKKAEELLMKNIEKEDDYDDFNDAFVFSSQYSSYRPTDAPSLKERYYESTTKRKEFIKKYQKEKDDNELKGCTFYPQKFSTYKIKKSKPQEVHI